MPQPDARRIASLIWFPFFFVVSLCLLLLASFANPVPHHLGIAVVGTSSQTNAVRSMLDKEQPDGFDVTTERAADARADVAAGTLAGALEPGSSRILVASGAGGSRATYVTEVLEEVGQKLSLATVAKDDVAPVVDGDKSGSGVFFFGIPLLLVGMITSIVLMQFGGWAFSRKIATIAIAGGFASVFCYLTALGMNFIPNDEWLLLFGFMLTQAIGWLTLGSAYFVRQFFLPVAMTFTLILGIPSAGGTVSGDMLPAFVRWLNTFMPFAQFVDLFRSSAYLNSSGLVVPIIVLSAWLGGGACLLVGTGLLARRRAARALAEERQEAAIQDPAIPNALGEVRGAVISTSGRALVGARVAALDDEGNETARVITDEDGNFHLQIRFGLHHLIVSAVQCEPAIVPISLHPSRPSIRRNVSLIDWSDPSGNLAPTPDINNLVLESSRRPHGHHAEEVDG